MLFCCIMNICTTETLKVPQNGFYICKATEEMLFPLATEILVGFSFTNKRERQGARVDEKVDEGAHSCM